MKEIVESDVPDILEKDGVVDNNLFSANQEIVNLQAILDNCPNSSWSYRVVDSDSNSATIICQNPGEGNREHYHPDWNEWWFIISGAWEWEIEGIKRDVTVGDFVFIQKGRKHKITAIGDQPAVRLAVSRGDVEHVYEK